VGEDTLNAFFPGVVFEANTIAGGEARRYPKGNTFISEDDFAAEFLDPAGGDYRLKPSSRLRGAASDRRDIGADVVAIAQALGLRPRPQPPVSR